MNRTAIPAALVLAGLALVSVPASAETRIEKNLTLAPGGEFHLQTDLGAVTVTGSPDAGAHLVITSKRKDLDDLLTFRFAEGANSATVIARKKHRGSWFSSDHGNSVQYEIRVPANTRLTLDTSGGSIHVSGMRAAAKLDTSGGGIRVEDLVGDLSADTSGGSIDLKDIKGKMRVETSGGGIDGVNLDGAVHAESSGGSIELQKVTGDIDAETSGGGIRLGEVDADTVADTSAGSISVKLAKAHLTAKTSGGGLEMGSVKRRPPSDPGGVFRVGLDGEQHAHPCNVSAPALSRAGAPG